MKTNNAFQKLIQRFEGGAEASNQLEKNTRGGTPQQQNFMQNALQKAKRLVSRPLPVPPKPTRKNTSYRFFPMDLARAIIENNLQMVSKLLKSQPELLHKVPLNKKIAARVKPLQQAILRAAQHLTKDNFEEAEKSLQVIQLLVSQGADVNAPDEEGALPLDWGFADKKHVPLAIALLQLGANPNKILNPLHRAVTFNSPELVKALIHAGVRLNSVDFTTNKTALEQAVDQRCPKAFSVLKFYSAPKSHALLHVNSKLFAHRFGLSGNVIINNKTVELEGFTSKWTLNDITHSFETFADSVYQLTAFAPFKNVLENTLAALQAANETEYKNISAQAKERLKDIKAHPLKHQVFSLTLDTGPDSSHSVQIMVRGDMLYICNRGSGAGDKPGTIGYKITKPGNLNDSIIFNLLREDLSPEYIQKDLHQQLGLEEKYYIPGEAQTVGNCSMASIQELVVALLFDNLLMNGTPPKEATAQAKNIAKAFDTSDKHDALENQLQYHLLLEPDSLEFELSATLLRKLFVKLDIEQPEQREMCQSISKALIFDPQRAPSRQVSTTLQYISLGLDLLQSQFIDTVFNKKDQTKDKLKAANLSEMSNDVLNTKHYLTGKPNEVDLLKQHPVILELNLHKAIQADDVKAVESLLKIESANRQKQCIDLLHLAVGYQSNKVLNWCIQHGEDVNATINEGQCKKLSPFTIAMLVNNKHAMNQLIKVGISTINDENFENSPLALAVGLGSVSLVKDLLKITPNFQEHLPRLIDLAKNHKQNRVLKLLQSKIKPTDTVDLTQSHTLLNQHKAQKPRAFKQNAVCGNPREMIRSPRSQRRMVSRKS